MVIHYHRTKHIKIMTREQMIEKQKLELKRLNRFRAHIPVMKVTVGLPDELVDEMISKINSQIFRCEIIIRTYK